MYITSVYCAMHVCVLVRLCKNRLALNKISLKKVYGNKKKINTKIYYDL